MRHVRNRHERGALAVESIGIIPMIVAFGLLFLQAFFAFSTVTSVEKAARDGARAASEGRSVTRAVQASVPGWLTVESIGSDNGGKVCPGRCVSVEARVPIGIPVFTLSDVTVTRSAAMPAGRP